MSIIGVARHNEVINMILYEDPPPRPKSAMYVSERTKQLQRQKRIPTHQSMGFAETLLRPPNCYLKKRGGVVVPKKSPLPDDPFFVKTKETGKKVGTSKKGPKKTTMKPLLCVDTPRGHKTNVMKYKWVYDKSTFGKTPKYIINQKNAIHKAETEYNEKLRNAPPLCRLVPPEERLELLNGLRHNRNEAQKAFLLLPMLTDTIPKVLHKSHLEKQVLQLEKDLRLVEENPYIYLYE